ncbi:MAG TPA: hypothetical protein VHW01_22430, partial [Polyangiaceae bacterium]|nr:hypothetical protein [Polyangiaceae bacterium]
MPHEHDFADDWHARSEHDSTRRARSRRFVTDTVVVDALRGRLNDSERLSCTNRATGTEPAFVCSGQRA